jgi:hypothetical protein
MSRAFMGGLWELAGRLSQRQGQMADAEGNLGGVRARQVEGDPNAAAEKSEDEAL